MRNSSGAETVAVGTLRAPATTENEGLADAAAATPLRLLRRRGARRNGRRGRRWSRRRPAVKCGIPYAPVTWVHSNSHAAKASPLPRTLWSFKA